MGRLNMGAEMDRGRHHILWLGDCALYDAATQSALLDCLAQHGWTVHTSLMADATYESFACVHCWDLAAIDTWFPRLVATSAADIPMVLSPAYDATYMARVQRSMLDPSALSPSPDVETAWRVARMREIFALTRMALLITTANGEAASLQRTYPQADAIPVTVVPPCSLPPAAACEVAPLAGIGPYVLCVAPIGPIYGQDEIIRAAEGALLTPVLVGGVDDGTFFARCRDSSVRAVWIPSLSREGLAAAIRSACVVIHPARDVAIPLTAALLGVRTVLPMTHPIREYLGPAAVGYARNDPATLRAALTAAVEDATPLTPASADGCSPAATAAALADAYNTATQLARRRTPWGIAYVAFLEAELRREYRANQLPDAVIATLESEVAWYRRLAEGKDSWRALRQSEAVARARATVTEQYARTLEASLAEKDAQAAAVEQYVRTLEASLAEKDAQAAAVERYVRRVERHIRELEAGLAAHDTDQGR
jgi:glycosyltransferase involved in cell wall biosynthesis